MWLLPVLSALSRATARLFYKLELLGPAPAGSGPMLLVANHPNSLLDPALVAAAAGRPVRFLAKSTLFTDQWVGWLVRAAGAIPVYRPRDDPQAATRNVEMFEAVFEQLSRGAAVGIFPEGLSHDEPSLAPLRTGAARIALGFFLHSGQRASIVPVGLVLRDKSRFRSQAVVVLGDPVEWGDLDARFADQQEAVRKLTQRIDSALREVTVNLDRWEDRPLVDCVVEIWMAAEAVGTGETDRLKRSRVAAEILARLRRSGGKEWVKLARQISAHRRRLGLLGLQPTDLGSSTDLADGLRWAVRRLSLLAPPIVALALVGAAAFWVPYRLTGLATSILRPSADQRSTFKVLLGAGIYLLWIALLTAGAWVAWGPVLGILCLLGLPVAGITGVHLHERWRGAGGDIRRFFLLRSRRKLIQHLKLEQERLADRLHDIYRTWGQGTSIAGAAGSGSDSAPPRQGVEIDVSS